ncbi:MAG: hypothetical protein AB1483_04485 [Candidatus Zixiibacteriota bacterium]
MFRTVKFGLAAAIILVLMAAGVFAQAPGTMTYQGKLTDDALNPISSATFVTFRIYDAEDAAIETELWADTMTVIPNEQGVFTVELGGTEPFPPGLFDGNVRYLGIQVEEDEEMMPRQAITSSPYSMSVGNAPAVRTTYISWASIGTSPASLGSISVQVTKPGYLVVEASGFMELYSSTSYSHNIVVSLNASSSTIDWTSSAYLTTRIETSSGYHYNNFCIKKIVPVTPGAYTYYLVGDGSSSVTIATLYYTNLVATFIPDALTAPVTAAPEMPSEQRLPATFLENVEDR